MVVKYSKLKKVETKISGSNENCKSEKLRELILETVGMYPHQYSYQAK